MKVMRSNIDGSHVSWRVWGIYAIRLPYYTRLVLFSVGHDCGSFWVEVINCKVRPSGYSTKMEINDTNWRSFEQNLVAGLEADEKRIASLLKERYVYRLSPHAAEGG
jgi:hypothetical protein